MITEKNCKLPPNPEHGFWGNGDNTIRYDMNQIRIGVISQYDIRKKVWDITSINELRCFNWWDLVNKTNEWKLRFIDKKPLSLDFHDELRQLYVFSNRKEVEQFISVHKELYKILFETHKQVERIFGDHVCELFLKVENDPEEDFEVLFAIIKTNLSPSDALALLNKLDEECFLDNASGEISSIFSVTVEIL